MGVGGIAVAMASKESLENLFGSFTIFLDQPFTVGDIVTIGAITGVVEKVGFRSTRIRTFDKSLVTVPNKKMIDLELDNLENGQFEDVNLMLELPTTHPRKILKKLFKKFKMQLIITP